MVVGGPARVYRARVQQRTDLVQRPHRALVPASVHGHRARGRQVEPEDHSHRRRFAGPVRPEEPGHVPRLDLEVDPVDRDTVAVHLPEFPRLDHAPLPVLLLMAATLRAARPRQRRPQEGNPGSARRKPPPQEGGPSPDGRGSVPAPTPGHTAARHRRGHHYRQEAGVLTTLIKSQGGAAAKLWSLTFTEGF